MALPVHTELVSRGRAGCGLYADALRKVILKRLLNRFLPRAQFSRPPLPSHAPCPYLLPYLSSRPPRVPAFTGRPSHPRVFGECRRDHSAAAWAMARGAEPWLERRRLILQPIQPPPTLGTTCHVPHVALTLSLAHVAVRRPEARARGGVAAAAETRGWPGCRSNMAASSSWPGRPMQAERRGRAGPQSRLGRCDGSFGACAPRGWVVSYFG